MPSLGPLEILIIVIVAVLVFPPHKLPEVARQAGRALGALRRFQGSLTADFERLLDDRDETPKLPPKPAVAERDPAPEAPREEPEGGSAEERSSP